MPKKLTAPSADNKPVKLGSNKAAPIAPPTNAFAFSCLEIVIPKNTGIK